MDRSINIIPYSTVLLLCKHSNDMVKLLCWVSPSAFLWVLLCISLYILCCMLLYSGIFLLFYIICLSVCLHVLFVCLWVMLPESNKMYVCMYICVMLQRYKGAVLWRNHSALQHHRHGFLCIIILVYDYRLGSVFCNTTNMFKNQLVELLRQFLGYSYCDY